jgi:Ni/Fe-hydrogenase 1 B-type cytochrome subunit
MENNHLSGVTGSSIFLQKHSAMIRTWHWLTFIILASSIITVLLTATLFNQRANIAVVQNQLKAKGVTVTEDQAFSVSREYEDKLWGVHKLLGYGLAFLLFSRVMIELMHPKEEKFRSRMKNARLFYKQNPDNKKEYRHYLVVKWSYLFFFALLLLMALTGLGLAFGRELSFSRELHNIVKEIHSFGQYLMYAFVLFHICGVIIADNTREKGIVSGMISGN